MQFTIPQPALKAALFTITRITKPAKGQIEQQVRLTATPTQLTLEATDTMIGACISVPADVQTPGTICVHGVLLLDLIKDLPLADPLRIEVDGPTNQVTIHTRQTAMRLHGMQDDLWPTTPDLPDAETLVQLPGAVLRAAADRVLCAVADDSASNPVLAGIFVERLASGLGFTAIDGYRAARLVHPLEADVPAIAAVVPGAAFATAARMLDDADVTLGITERMAIMTTASAQIWVRLKDGAPINVERFIQPTQTTLTMTTEGLTSLISRLKALWAQRKQGTKDIASSTVLRYDAERVLFETVVPGVGTVVDAVPVALTGTPGAICVSIQYLLQALQTVPGDTLAIRVATPDTPLIVAEPGDPTYWHMVMPMRPPEEPVAATPVAAQTPVAPQAAAVAKAA